MRPAILLSSLLLACGEAPTVEDPTDDVAADTVDTTPQTDPNAVRACIVETWFVRTCTGCHFGGNHLDLTRNPLDVLRDGRRENDPTAPLLVPGDADDSLLVRKLAARAGLLTLEEGEGDPMPPDRSIRVEDAEQVRDWVASGAPDCP